MAAIEGEIGSVSLAAVPQRSGMAEDFWRGFEGEKKLSYGQTQGQKWKTVS
jgi:hypothetical protein